MLAGACMGPLFALPEEDQSENLIAALDWKKGPTTAKVGYVASQEVKNGYVFLEADETRKFVELIKSLPSDSYVGVIGPEDLSWFAVYSYDDIGYVKDDEKENLDSSELLKALRKGNQKGNEELRRRGWPEMELVGWAREPHYDEKTHNLEWGVKFSVNGEKVVNYNTRVLGRGGVMSVILVCAPDELSSVLPDFKSALKGFSYTAGNRYSEYRSGDRTAELGLSALIVGGATAAAVKTGAFKWLWKGLVAVFLAIGAFFKKLFGKGKKEGQ